MSQLTRRDFSFGLTTLSALAALADAQSTATGGLGSSKVFAPEFQQQANGSQRWQPFEGVLGSGEAVSMHVSIVPAGTPPPALHTIHHAEFIVLVEGDVTFEHDGTSDKASAGSVLYVANGTSHRIWNTGTGTAKYFVVQVGGDTRKG